MQGEELMPVITDNFVLLPLSGACKNGEEVRVVFQGRALDVPRIRASDDPIFVSAEDPDGIESTAQPESVSLPPAVPEKYQDGVRAALSRAGKNAPELLRAIRETPPEQKEAVCFLIANMPDVDLRSLEAAFIREHVEWACRARQQLRWGSEIPDELFLNYVLPYASVNERRDQWRRDFFERFLPVVKDCKSAAEAAQLLNQRMFEMVGVRYHATKRPKPDQSPYESIEAGYASCTGLSILLVDACRAVCVPARLAGTPQWTTKSGNHTWVEIWDGQWYFVGAAEPDPKGLNRAWFVSDAAAADPDQPLHRIYATSFRRTPLSFPLVWAPGLEYVRAHDVTRYYTARKAVRIHVLDQPGGHTVAAHVVLRWNGEPYALGSTQAESDSAEGLRFELPADEPFAVEIKTPGGNAIHLAFVVSADGDQDFVFTLQE